MAWRRAQRPALSGKTLKAVKTALGDHARSSDCPYPEREDVMQRNTKREITSDYI
jgi:hypothetical protein